MPHRSGRLKKRENDSRVERNIMVFNNPKLREILHAELCGRDGDLRWAAEKDFEPGIRLRLLSDKVIQEEIRKALASHGWVPPEGHQRLPDQVPWAWRYRPGTSCPCHKDTSPKDQWSLVIGVKTQGELIHINFGPGMVQSYSLLNGDMLLFRGAVFDHWTDTVDGLARVIVAWHLSLSNQVPG